MIWYLEIAAVLIIIAVVLGLAWRFAPPTWKVVAVNMAAAGLFLFSEVLTVLTGFEWGKVLPPEYVPWAGLVIAVLNVVARFKTTAPVGEPGAVK